MSDETPTIDNHDTQEELVSRFEFLVANFSIVKSMGELQDPGAAMKIFAGTKHDDGGGRVLVELDFDTFVKDLRLALRYLGGNPEI